MIYEMAETGDHSIPVHPLTIRDLVYLRICRKKLKEEKIKLAEEKIKLYSSGINAVCTILADIRKIVFDSSLHFDNPGQEELYRLTLPSSRGREDEIKSRMIIGRSRPKDNK